MSSKDGTWRCPVCKETAQIAGQKISIRIVGSRTWPKHPDCELGKALDCIDFSKLEKVS